MEYFLKKARKLKYLLLTSLTVKKSHCSTWTRPIYVEFGKNEMEDRASHILGYLKRHLFA